MYRKGNKELEIIALYAGGYEKQLYLREISRMAKIPTKTTQNLLSFLEKNNILKSIIRGKNKYFRLNLDNIQTKLIILQSEIYKTALFLKKYPQFKTFLKSLTANTPLIVFGSFARLTANKDSDLDLMIIAKKEPGLPLHLIPNSIHQVNLSEYSFIKAIKEQEALMKEMEENHIILNNHSFYVNAMWDSYGK